MSWNRGYTKETHASVRKISDTMRKRKINNFSKWRKLALQRGQIVKPLKIFEKNGDFAELIGVVLGDGHIQRFPRTERLMIFSNSANTGFVERYARLVEKVFDKKPYIFNQTGQNCTRISLYQKDISKRLGVPSGARKKLNIRVPRWVLKDKSFIIRYLRGLYEAEGSISIHKKTYTHKFLFSNLNQSLLRTVFHLLKRLDFQPHQSIDKIQISRKEEVQNLANLLEFRRY